MSTLRNFHEGEAILQAESGVDTLTFDAMVHQAFQPEMNVNEVGFVQDRTFSVAASVDGDGRPWASPLIGTANELFAVQDAVTVRVMPQPIEGDPLVGNIGQSGELGVLFFDPSRRRRAKSLGKATGTSDGSISYRMHRFFGLCNKYIYKRSHYHSSGDRPPDRAAPRIGTSLEQDDWALLEAADTIFLASSHVEHGVDPTHRGGPPGFVTVRDDATLTIPDYSGNGMFQTLGNLLMDDHIGLMAVDFQTGRTVQVTGRGFIDQSEPDDIYSVRTLRIAIEEVRTTWPDIGQWTDIEPFELKPGLKNPATPFL